MPSEILNRFLVIEQEVPQALYESILDSLVNALLTYYFSLSHGFNVCPQWTFRSEIENPDDLETQAQWSLIVEGEDLGLVETLDSFDSQLDISMSELGFATSTPRAESSTAFASPTSSLLSFPLFAAPHSSLTSPGTQNPQSQTSPASPFLAKPDIPESIDAVLDVHGRLVILHCHDLADVLKRPDFLVDILSAAYITGVSESPFPRKPLVVIENKLRQRKQAVRQLLDYMRRLRAANPDLIGMAFVMTAKGKVEVAILRQNQDGLIRNVGQEMISENGFEGLKIMWHSVESNVVHNVLVGVVTKFGC